VAERMQLVEDLWDSVAAEANADPDRLPMSEVLRRSDAYRRNPGAAIPLEEALERIERSLG
jgi:putative addiction module component (TIGR02574 family)